MVPVSELFLDRGREMRDVHRAGIMAAYRSLRSKRKDLIRWIELRAVPVMIVLGIE